MLRTASLKIITALGIEGGCNVQLALAPNPETTPWAVPPGDALPPYYVIEVNPRVSRSSALASKATGYPIARVAAKIAVGKTLDQIPNAVTQKTTAAFEPALDYVVVKIPRWPFDKFPFGDRTLGTQMKATGEVMAIDRTFEGALQKAVRSLEIGGRSLLWEDPAGRTTTASARCTRPTSASGRSWPRCGAARPARDLSRKTGVDQWFLHKLDEHRRDGEAPARRAADAGPAARGEAHGLLRRADRDARRPPARAGARPARRSGTSARCTRWSTPARPSSTRRRRTSTRTYEQENEAIAAAGQEGARHRQRADPHRAGHRVRLLLRARRVGAGARRLQVDHGELEPGDRLHGLRHERPPLLRAARRRVRARHPRERSRRRRRGRRRAAARDRAVRRADGDQSRRAAAQRRARRSSARRSRRSTWRRTAAASRSSSPASASRSRRAPPSCASRTRFSTADALGYPGARAPQLRARRPRDGDRAEPDRTRALRAAGGRGRPTASRSSSTSTSKAKRSRSTRSATARACSSPASWSTSSAPACTPATRWRSTRRSTSRRPKSTRSSTTRRASASRSTCAG